MNLIALEQAANKIYSETLRALNFRYEDRYQLGSALAQAARSAGHSEREVFWIASRGLSWSGFGGGF